MRARFTFSYNVYLTGIEQLQISNFIEEIRANQCCVLGEEKKREQTVVFETFKYSNELFFLPSIYCSI